MRVLDIYRRAVLDMYRRADNGKASGWRFRSFVALTRDVYLYGYLSISGEAEGSELVVLVVRSMQAETSVVAGCGQR
jgi:hypothetical protein